jgi:hypothetical protein
MARDEGWRLQLGCAAVEIGAEVHDWAVGMAIGEVGARWSVTDLARGRERSDSESLPFLSINAGLTQDAD